MSTRGLNDIRVRTYGAIRDDLSSGVLGVIVYYAYGAYNEYTKDKEDEHRRED